MNVYRTMHVTTYASCFRRIWRNLKAYTIEQILSNNNILKFNNKCTRTRCEISLTIKAITVPSPIISMVNWACSCSLGQLWILLFHSKITYKVLIKMKKRRIGTSRVVFLKKLHLKCFHMHPIKLFIKS